MSDESKQSLVITAYKGKDTADEVYHVLRTAEKESKEIIDIKTAATVTRKSNGKLKLKHRKRLTVKKGAFAGGALGLILAGTGVGLLGGAVVGALIGSSGRKDRTETKKFLEDKLGPDDSALVMLINDADWERAQALVDKFEGEDLVVELTEDAEKQLAALADDPEVAAAVEEEVEVEEVTEE